MRKILLVCTATFLATASLSSQISIGKGIKGGLNLASVGGADAEKFGTVTGVSTFNAGVFLNIGLPGPFSIQPEVLYTRKGVKITGTSPLLPFTSTVTDTYVELPVLVKFGVLSLPGSPVKPNIFAGPSVGILLSAKSKTEIPGFPAQENDGKDETKSIDLGIVVGAGVDLDLVVVSLNVDARYGFGLATFDKSPSPGPYDLKHRVFSVNVGLGL